MKSNKTQNSDQTEIKDKFQLNKRISVKGQDLLKISKPVKQLVPVPILFETSEAL